MSGAEPDRSQSDAHSGTLCKGGEEMSKKRNGKRNTKWHYICRFCRHGKDTAIIRAVYGGRPCLDCRIAEILKRLGK